MLLLSVLLLGRDQALSHVLGGSTHSEVNGMRCLFVRGAYLLRARV